jgi:hypothetical protein
MILRSFLCAISCNTNRIANNRPSWGPQSSWPRRTRGTALAVDRLDFGNAACPPGKEQQAEHASHSRRRVARAARAQPGTGSPRYRKRAGAFGVIQLWIVNSFMIEVLADEMQADAVAKIF